MARQAKLSHKIVSLIVSITFLLTQFVIDVKPVYSALPQALPLPEPNEITIPEAYGKITETFKGDSGKLVFHIQDLHTNPEAQQNSARIFEHLIDTYGVKLLTIEGETGPINPEWLANVSMIKPINDKMAEIFLNSGEMTGEEYLYVTTYPKYKDVAFWGIEDKDPYRKNRDIFSRMYPRIRENLRLCDSIKGGLDKLKKEIYPEQAVELDEKRTAYEARELEVKDYTSYLIDLAKQKGVDISKYENFSVLAKLVDIQEKLEFSRVDKERTLLFDALSKALSEEGAKQMMDKVKEHNEGKSTAIEFYTYLKGLAVDNGIDFAQYPNINTYMEYISTSERLNNNELFKELDQVEDDLVGSLLTTDEQKRLAQLSKMLNIMKKFFDINLSNENLDYYEKNKAEFKVQTFTDFIKEKAKQYNIRYSLDPAINQLDKTLLEQDEFYKVVLVRDEAMVNNTIKKMDETGANITIQPIGGFHTKGMVKMYKERGISYVVISPHVTKEFDEENYRNILLEKKRPVKELIEEFRKTLRPEGMSSKPGAPADAVAAAVYIAQDAFKEAGASDEEALRAALRTVNPEFLTQNVEKLPGDLKDVAKALKDETPAEVNFENLTTAEKEYWVSLGIKSFDDVLFVTGVGFAGLAIFDKEREKILVHRWWGLAGIVYRTFEAGEKSRKIDLLIGHSIADHSYEHVKNPESTEEEVYNKQAETLLASGANGRQVANDMAEGLKELQNGVSLANKAYPGVYSANTARYITYLKAVGENFEGVDREDVISRVAEASEAIAGLYASQQTAKGLTAILAEHRAREKEIENSIPDLINLAQDSLTDVTIITPSGAQQVASDYYAGLLQTLQRDLADSLKAERRGINLATVVDLARQMAAHILSKYDDYSKAQNEGAGGIKAQAVDGNLSVDVGVLFDRNGTVRVINPAGTFLGYNTADLQGRVIKVINTYGFEEGELKRLIRDFLGVDIEIQVVSRTQVASAPNTLKDDNLVYLTENADILGTESVRAVTKRRVVIDLKEGKEVYLSVFAIATALASNSGEIMQKIEPPNLKDYVEISGNDAIVTPVPNNFVAQALIEALRAIQR
ncbi:MAG: hypothetical protein FJZ16_02195 [Candidatus Omnitrophica bacterium]|nr:hypothetical protein [Candidatus Omnitrophota bacterium]